VPEIAWVFALILALFISIFPTIDREFRTSLTLGLIVIIIFFFLAMPAFALLTTRDMMEVGSALARSLIEFMKIMAVLLYWGPILLGVYGIFSKERGHLFLSVIFFIGIIITTDLYLLAINVPHTKTASNIPLYTIFALALFCYYEMGDSSITFYDLNDSPHTWQRRSAHQEHLDRILQKYFVYFILFSAMALVLTVPILEFDQILSTLGSDQIGASMELNSIYGTIVSLFIIVFILIMIGYIFKFENKFKEFFIKIANKIQSKLPWGSPVEFGRGRSRDDDDDYKPPPPPPPKSVIFIDE
jgi:hypothetical protein